MSLDFTLTVVRPTIVFDGNITHNLSQMAVSAGLYDVLWRPDENGILTAAELLPRLRAGLANLISVPDEMRKLEPSNGWGKYEDLLRFVREIIAACEQNPDATISVSR